MIRMKWEATRREKRDPGIWDLRIAAGGRTAANPKMLPYLTARTGVTS
jgi:hypothetical protein